MNTWYDAMQLGIQMYSYRLWTCQVPDISVIGMIGSGCDWLDLLHNFSALDTDSWPLQNFVSV